MLKQHETIRDRDAVIGHPGTIDELPELPEGVVVPHDLSGLETAGRRRRPVRWLGWAAALVTVVGGGALIATQIGDDAPAAAPIRTEAYENDVRDYYAGVYEGHLARSAAVAEVPAYDPKQQAIDTATAALAYESDVRDYYAGLYEAQLARSAAVAEVPAFESDVREYYAGLYEDWLAQPVTAEVPAYETEVREYYAGLYEDWLARSGPTA